MNILEQIKAGAKLGYSATFVMKQNNGKKYQTLFILANMIGCKSGNRFSSKNEKELEGAKITGWLYVGQLFGESEIPEGQRFRVKKTGEIKDFKEIEYGYESLVMLKDGLSGNSNEYQSTAFDKSEIEPYFE